MLSLASVCVMRAPEAAQPARTSPKSAAVENNKRTLITFSFHQVEAIRPTPSSRTGRPPPRNSADISARRRQWSAAELLFVAALVERSLPSIRELSRNLLKTGRVG